MRSFTWLATLASLSTAIASPVSSNTANGHDSKSTGYTNWRTFSGYGVNLGGWLEQESTIDTRWWSTYGTNTSDEWTICENLGSACSRVFEERYATYITTADIDTLASAGVSILRIPTTYAAWIRLPGSQMYSGNQQKYLRRITEHATKKHGMRVVIDLHSLPGGTNGLDIGEKVGNWGWWHNETALEWSLRAVDEVAAFIQSSSSPQSYTLEPINEPADNHDLSQFGTAAALTEDGATWLLKYFNAVIAHVKKVNAKIPVMLQGSFKTEEYWSPHFDASENIVFDLHHYYFQYAEATSANVTEYICKDAKASAGDGKFPTFVGEWAIETGGENELGLRKKNLQAGLSAWAQYTRGSSYWTAKFLSNATIVGEGVKQDYWNFEGYIADGFLKGDVLVKNYCQ
jgi:aryl-phospho-beta-D-glucosidase BglC (GH1 family)